MTRWNFLPTPVSSETMTWTFTLGALASNGNQFAITSYAESGAGQADWFEYTQKPFRSNNARARFDWYVKVDGTNGEYSTASDFTSNATVSDFRLVHDGSELTIDSLSLHSAGRNTIVIFRFNTSDGTNQFNAMSNGDDMTIGITYS